MTILKNKRFWIVLTIILLLLVITNISHNRQASFSNIENLFITITKPINRIVFATTNTINNSFQSFIQIASLKDNNEQLMDEIALIKMDKVRLKELELENQRLREMIDFKEESYNYEMVGAKVIGRNPDNWFENIVIDKGYNSGIDINMAVVTHKGVVGYITDIGSNWSKVLLMIDQRSAISGMIQRTRDNGVVKGHIEPVTLGYNKMVYLPAESNIVTGDLVISSGLGGVFPKGLSLGEVVSVNYEDSELLKFAVIKPSVDFQRLEEVFVIKSKKGELKEEE